MMKKLKIAVSIVLMKTLLLFFCFLSLNSYAQLDFSGVPGTANQVEKDPAQRGFEKEYEELHEVFDELDEPQRQSEKDHETKPTHDIQTEPYDSRVNE